MPELNITNFMQNFFKSNSKVIIADNNTSQDLNENDDAHSITESSFEIERRDELRRYTTEHKQPNLEIQPNSIVYTDTQIDKGRYASVYLGTFNETQVALKQITLFQYSIDRCLKEFNMLSNLQNCNYVIKLYGYFVNQSHFTLVTEYIQNGTLTDLLGTNYLSDWKIRFQIWKEICQGVMYIHSKDLIHRDLKSPNVLITGDWHVKIIDFGLTISTNEKKPFLAGSLRWVAPEVLSKQVYSHASDIFSTGRILSELINLTIPFSDYDIRDDEVKEELAEKIQQGFEDKLSSENCPPSMLAQAKACLHFKPGLRPTAEILVRENEKDVDKICSM